jgi:hypothetical protein
MGISEFVYTVLPKPRPLKMAANAAIRRFLPPKVKRHEAVLVPNPRDPVVSGSLTFGVYETAETAFPVELPERLEGAQSRLFELDGRGNSRTLRGKRGPIDRPQGRGCTNGVRVRGDALPAAVKIDA